MKVGSLALLIVVIGSFLAGCSEQPAGDYKEPAEGTYQQSSETGKSRTRAEEPTSKDNK